MKAWDYLATHHGHRVLLYIALVVTLTLVVQLAGVPWTW